MAIASVTVTTPAESAKSIKIELDSLYANESIKLEYSSTVGGTFTDVTSNYNISLVKDSSKADITPAPSQYYYCLVVGKFDYYEEGGHSSAIQSLIDETLKDGYYKITIGGIPTTYPVGSSSVNVEATLAAGSDFDGTIPVTATGSSILQLRFTAPIRNLFVNHYEALYGSNILDNISYKSDEIGDVQTPFKVNATSFKGYLSNDGKVLTLESSDFNFIEGSKITAYINSPRFQQPIKSTNTVLTDYDKSLTILSPDSASDANAVVVEDAPAKVTTASGTRTKLNATFDKPVLLPSKTDLSVNNILSTGSPTERAVTLTSAERSSYDFVIDNNANIKAQYTKLSLNILPTTANALPAGNAIPVSIGATPQNETGALVDASTFLVTKTSVTGPITAETPKVISAIQNMTPSIQDTTEIDITFSQAMNISPITGATSALDPDNYSLRTSAVAIVHYPTSIQVVPNSGNTKFKAVYTGIITSAVGETVTLTVADTVTNAMGDAFSSTGTDNIITLSQLKDTTIPEVIQIIGLNKSPDNTGTTVTDKDNALIIKFKTPMAITGANSAIIPTNYKFVEKTVSSTNSPLKGTASAVAGITSSNSWILFTVDTNSSYPVFEQIKNTKAIDTITGKPNLNYDIHIGYTGLTNADYKYVENTAGNIYPICDYKKIDATVPLIDLSKGTITIVDDHTLKYTYTDTSIVNNIIYHNEFRKDTIIASNFEIYELDEFNCAGAKTQLTINTVTLDDTGTVLEFTFAPNTLSSDTKYIYLTEKSSTTPVLYDIFNKEVTGVFCNEVINDIPTALDSLTLIDLATKLSVDPNNPDIIGYPIEIAASFANPIAITSVRDFIITLSSPGAVGFMNQNVPVSSASILQVNGKNSNVIILKCYIPTIGFDFIDNGLFVRTFDTTEIQYLRTKDFDNKSIQAFTYTAVGSFNVTNTAFKFDIPGDLDGASLSTVFNNDIVDSSVPAKVLAADGLLVKDLKFIQNTTESNFYYAGLSNTAPKLGYLILSVKSPTGSIFASGISDTTFDVTITKFAISTLVFEFSKSDTAADLKLNMDNVIYMQYIPSKYNLMGIDANDYNVYANVSDQSNANASIK